jgi:kexin
MRILVASTILLCLSAFGLSAAEPGVTRHTKAAEERAYEWYDGDKKRSFHLSLDQLGVYTDSSRAAEFYKQATRDLLRQLMPDATVESMEGRVVRLRLTDKLTRSAIVSRYGELRQDGRIGWVDAVFHDRSDPEKKSAYQLTGKMIVHFTDAVSEPAATAWGDGFGVRMLRRLKLANAYLFNCPAGPACLELTVRARSHEQVRHAYPNWIRPKAKRNDTLYPNQWHLNNTGQGGGTAGEDARLEDAWNSGYSGTGVRIAIVDDGLEIDHEDLADNVVSGGSYDYVDLDADPTAGDHGTACAGVAAAVGLNDLGVRGAGYTAELVGFRLLGAETDEYEADALTRDNQSVAIYSNSWGPVDNGAALVGPGPLTMAALESGVNSGRGGLGNLYVWAGGNGLNSEDNSNYDGYANSRYTIAVGASTNLGEQSWYSEPGANLLVNAPSSSVTLGITTTDRTGGAGYDSGNYTSSFGGTSSAAPLVAGVLSLILEANPNLSWRDVKLLLANTAAMNDPVDYDWTTNAAGLHINHKYGYGRIDAGAAVLAASSWAPVGTEYTSETTSSPNLAIPDGLGAGSCGPWVADVLSIADDLSIESVEVNFQSQHTYWGDLEILLVSPSGTESMLAEYHNGSGEEFAPGWTFGVERLIGESSLGTWTLKARDCFAADSGNIQNWSVKVFGTAEPTFCSAGPHTVSNTHFTNDEIIQSESTLDTDGTVTVQSGANVVFEAGNMVTLMPGFHAPSGSLFRAAIAPVSCP